ncbi:MAG: hydroxymethylglutaryl-CoA synthase family protein [Oligoflexia bacterium]|nr:hydroxymethylglutaryl-CoA synthase family protein [Oligoflexia bacterium]
MMGLELSVGIDRMAVYIPKLYLPLTEEWAQKRAEVFTKGDVKKLIQKIEKGVGVTKIAVPDMHEDSATMAAMAVKELLDTHKIPLSDIGYLAISSESSVDQSKPISAYVLGMLESYYHEKAPHIGCTEFKFACVGSTYALEAAINLVKGNAFQRPYALVVATDIDQYDLKSAGEYTQGAGAVAMLISKNPRFLALDN